MIFATYQRMRANGTSWAGPSHNRGNTDQLEFEPLWNAMVHVVEMDGDGTHILRQTEGGDLETTTNIFYTPPINPITQFIKNTVELLESEGKKKRKDFKVLYRTWVMLQLSTSHDNK